jgi:DNA-binding winged helix-turn-helix (wHTH) protein/tetratricopeptide (TPR) repeat protein
MRRNMGRGRRSGFPGASYSFPIFFAARLTSSEMPSPVEPTRYAIGVYELDTQQKIVLRDGVRVSLTPKAVDLLLVLAARAGEVVPKADLMEAVWPDAVVDESTLSKLVFNIRKELGDEVIETIPKRGYRLVNAGQAPPPPLAPSPSRTHRPLLYTILATVAILISLAFLLLRRPETASANNLMVMPFTGADAELSHSVSEFITSRLSALGISTKHSGAQLVLNGIVERSGDGVRVSYRLTSVDDGAQLGSASLTAPASGIADLEGSAAEGIATLIKLRQAVEKDHDKALATPARQLTYLRALAQLTPATTTPQPDEAIALLESLGPESRRSVFVLTALGRAWMHKGLRNPKHMRMMQSYADQAARIDPNHPAVHALRGRIDRFRGQYADAERELRASLAADPDAADVLLDLARVLGALSRTKETVATYNYLLQVHPECALCVHSYGIFEMETGRPEHAAELFRRAITLDPDSPRHRVALATISMKMGRLDEAVQRFQEAIRLAPTGGAVAALAECQFLTGDAESAARNVAEAVRLEPNEIDPWSLYGDVLRALHREQEANAAYDRSMQLARAIIQLDPQEPEPRAILAACLAKRGNMAEAKKEIALAFRDPDPVPALFECAAMVDMLAGDNDAAIEMLKRAVAKGISPSLYVRDPRLAPLRTTRQFMMWTQHALPMSSLSR